MGCVLKVDLVAGFGDRLGVGVRQMSQGWLRGVWLKQLGG